MTCVNIDCNVSMEEWVRILVRSACYLTNLGVIFTQPDMLDHSRIHEDDFPLKIGMAMILLEFRVQQSPKTRLYRILRRQTYS